MEKKDDSFFVILPVLLLLLGAIGLTIWALMVNPDFWLKEARDWARWLLGYFMIITTGVFLWFSIFKKN